MAKQQHIEIENGFSVLEEARFSKGDVNVHVTSEDTVPDSSNELCDDFTKQIVEDVDDGCVPNHLSSPIITASLSASHESSGFKPSLVDQEVPSANSQEKMVASESKILSLDGDSSVNSSNNLLDVKEASTATTSSGNEKTVKGENEDFQCVPSRDQDSSGVPDALGDVFEAAVQPQSASSSDVKSSTVTACEPGHLNEDTTESIDNGPHTVQLSDKTSDLNEDTTESIDNGPRTVQLSDKTSDLNEDSTKSIDKSPRTVLPSDKTRDLNESTVSSVNNPESMCQTEDSNQSWSTSTTGRRSKRSAALKKIDYNEISPTKNAKGDESIISFLNLLVEFNLISVNLHIAYMFMPLRAAIK